MNFKEIISKLLKQKNIDLFVDMDGVIASYDFGNPKDFDKKRPLKTNIKTLEEISKLNGITINILSICKKDSQIKEKNDWLDIHAPFFEKDKRYILSKETITNTSSPNMKLNFLRDYQSNNQKVLLDDDNQVLKIVGNNLEDVIVFQDSELID
jgi:hypothetical protein